MIAKRKIVTILLVFLLGFGAVYSAKAQGVPFDYDGKPKTAEERMAMEKVNGVSIAVVRMGQPDTLLQWGRPDAQQDKKVDENTLFQAGGVTTLLTNIVALQAVERGLLELDEDVNKKLTSWKLPVNKYNKKDPVTLRDLMLKRRGFTQPSKPKGYRPDEALPTFRQILEGQAPAKNKPVLLRSGTHKQKNYSFETELIVQQLLMDVYQKDFATLMKEQVLDPLGMKNSRFAPQLSAQEKTNAATGYMLDGNEVPGKQWIYPELGFSGLWTTPKDMALLLADLLKGERGDGSQLLSTSMIKEGLKPMNNSKCLLMNRYSDDGACFYGGASKGFRTQIEFYPKQQWALVVFMNSNENWKFMNEVSWKLKAYFGI